MHATRSSKVLLGLAVLVPVGIAAPVHLGLHGFPVDDPMPTGNDLAALAIDTTQYLVTLATAVLGLVGLFLSRDGTAAAEHLDRKSREHLAYGALACGASLWTGFVSLEVVLRASADAVVRASVGRWVFWLHLWQLIALAVGVALIGVTLLSRLLVTTIRDPSAGRREQ